ncbi:SDR family oxidoreductase [Lysinibacillus sphaericus]|uniref:NAD(P)-dependent oxidoreductase n=1 Tax=Lysinibacillus sphaericus TaxID=1421 RepID=UPI0025A20108|nr:SDR family oxidoreductase [Lysinibacillus sphaericus]MDM5350184.1 SDR family oxidoreductase [Lysinibacillus sphaericus]UZM97320.1 SDR family oxidoreductase [Lysinibacillus sp. MHQ-1]
MKILVLGATGRVGRKIVEFALKDQHEVTTFVRDPHKLQMDNKKLHIFQGNVLNKNDLEQAMVNVDVVVSALNTDGNDTLSTSILLILEVMEQQKIKRIITIGTAGILQSRVSPTILRYQSTESKRKSTFAAKEHQYVFEQLHVSNVDWTIVCPTYLPDGSFTGTYRVERNFLPEGGSEISVADTAYFAYQQIFSKEFVKTRVGLAY